MTVTRLVGGAVGHSAIPSPNSPYIKVSIHAGYCRGDYNTAEKCVVCSAGGYGRFTMYRDNQKYRDTFLDITHMDVTGADAKFFCRTDKLVSFMQLRSFP